MNLLVIIISIMLARMGHIAILQGDASSTPHYAWSILQHLLLVSESTWSFALDQVGPLNLDPFCRLNSRATKIYMI